MKFEFLHPCDQLVSIMNRIYYGRMTTLSGGNLSIKDTGGNIWITPAATDKGNMRPDDIVCMHSDGSIRGQHKPSSEYPFHQAIYARRPDFKAVVHAHAPALVAFSIARVLPEPRILDYAAQTCGEVIYAPYALTGSALLGDNIADAFAQGYDVVMLENHGVVAGGPDLLRAFQRMESLDFCARTQIKAMSLGELQTLSDAQVAELQTAIPKLPPLMREGMPEQEYELRRQLVDIAHRAYKRYLLTGTGGVASLRVDEDAFLITPGDEDHRELTDDDVVLVRGKTCEAQKLPARSYAVHQAIYRAHPEVNCILFSPAPHITAYAVVGKSTCSHFDTRLIPESYLMLRDMPVLPYAAYAAPGEQIAATISPATPVLLVQNAGVLTTGKTPLQAFDRLEVAEFSAKALLDAQVLGGIVPIGTEEIEELKQAFKM